MSKAIIYGNGKSRLGFDINKKYKDIITWGCNKIHHEGKVDNLVAVDYLAQQEVYQSGYAKNNKCWFLDWNKLPKEFIDKPVFGSRHLELLKLGFLEDEIFETEKGNRTRCVVQGKNPKTAVQKYNSLLIDKTNIMKSKKLLMSDDEARQLRHKCMRNTGLYITWLDKVDLVNNIEEFTGHSAGNTAMYLAAKQGVDEIFLLGFDLSTINQPHSNVYLLEDYKLGFDSTTWQNQMKTVMRKFKDVKFTWVSPMLETESFEGIDNLKFTTSEKFEEYLSCHHYMGH